MLLCISSEMFILSGACPAVDLRDLLGGAGARAGVMAAPPLPLPSMAGGSTSSTGTSDNCGPPSYGTVLDDEGGLGDASGAGAASYCGAGSAGLIMLCAYSVSSLRNLLFLSVSLPVPFTLTTY